MRTFPVTGAPVALASLVLSWQPLAQAQAQVAYAGSLSLSRELAVVREPARIEAGDVIIQGGSPGHAVLVVDVAGNDAGERAFLLVQSYMPAQDIHVLRRPGADDPWYRARSTGELRTPERIFDYSDVRRFAPVDCPPAAN